MAAVCNTTENQSGYKVAVEHCRLWHHHHHLRYIYQFHIVFRHTNGRWYVRPDKRYHTRYHTATLYTR